MRHSVVGDLLRVLYPRRAPLRGPCNRLFIGGLSYDTNEIILKEAFEEHGVVLEAKVICHHVSAKSKGYGFVQFELESEATKALEKMDGQLLDGRKIRISYAKNGLRLARG